MSESLRPYPAYRDSGVAWLGDVPAHWGLIRTKTLLRERSQKGFPDEPLLAATQTKGVVRKEQYENRTVLALKDLHLLKLVRVGDFVISLRSFQGGIEYAREQGIISPAYTILSPVDRQNYGYLALLFKSKPFIEDLTLFVTGIREGQNIDYEKLSRSPLPLPPLPEQSAIVRFLDHADRRLRRAIRAKRQLIALLNEQKQAIIHRAVTRGLDPDVPLKPSGVEWLGEVPAHWRLLKLKRLATKSTSGIQMGPFGASLTHLEDHETGFKLYGQVNTISGDFKKGRRWLTKKQFEELRRYEILPGDLVLTRKGSIGKCKIVPEGIQNGLADSDTIRVRLDEDQILRTFVVTLLHDAPYIQRQIESVQRGAVLGGLNTTTVANLMIAIPPKPEQLAVVRYLDETMTTLDHTIAATQREIDLLLEFRTRLIADVVTGKLDVREAAAGLPDEAEEPALFDEFEVPDDEEQDASVDLDVDPEGIEA